VERYVDQLGNIWVGDRYYKGGTAVEFQQIPIALTRDPEIYRTVREGEFSYDIPLKAGVYQLQLHFSENQYGPDTNEGGGESSRLIDVSANGQSLLSQFDIVADAGGGKTADIKVFTDIVPKDGLLRLVFSGFKVKGIVSGIEVLPGTPGQLRPIRISTQNAPLFSKDKKLWEADHFYRGGRSVLRNLSVSGTEDPQLFQGERYGNFSYTFPVVPGKYLVNLYFVETYFGGNTPVGGGIGSRIFDVLCNGEALLRNFDLFKEARGENRVLVRQFHNIKPTSQNKIILNFWPVVNYAKVAAIEVLPEK
jgi:hypothetical protein